MKKERIKYIIDSFVDYAGITHKFVIAAISQVLPVYGHELDDCDSDDEDCKVTYEVAECMDDCETGKYLGRVCKVLRIGVSVCNPIDTFNEKVGAYKAVARARASTPVFFATDPGVINTGVVKALLIQESEYLKNNPERIITGYNDAHKRYLANQRMQSIKENFSEIEKQVVENLHKDPKFLDNVLKYLNV